MNIPKRARRREATELLESLKYYDRDKNEKTNTKENKRKNS